MKRILLIDDDDDFRKMLKISLEKAGYEVLEAEDGKVGCQIYNRTLCDLVITDIFMPVKEGFETIATLKNEHPDVKIIAISGGGQYKHLEFLAMAGEFGAAAVMEKPLKVAHLLEKIERLL